jgi:hypothetical protein
MTVATSDAPSNSKAYQTPSDLLPRFIAQHKELQNYKYALWRICCGYDRASNGCELTRFFLSRLQKWKACSLGRPFADRGGRCRNRPLRCFCRVRRRARDPGAHGQIAQRACWQGASKQKCVRREHRSWGERCVVMPRVFFFPSRLLFKKT